jgi:hypothetical protein
LKPHCIANNPSAAVPEVQVHFRSQARDRQSIDLFWQRRKGNRLFHVPEQLLSVSKQAIEFPGPAADLDQAEDSARWWQENVARVYLSRPEKGVGERGRPKPRVEPCISASTPTNVSALTRGLSILPPLFD